MEADRSNQSMKPMAPLRDKLPRVCYDILPWLISFSLGLLHRGHLQDMR